MPKTRLRLRLRLMTIVISNVNKQIPRLMKKDLN